MAAIGSHRVPKVFRINDLRSKKGFDFRSRSQIGSTRSGPAPSPTSAPAQRANAGPQGHLVGDAIHLVVMISGGSAGRKVTEIARVDGFEGGRYLLEALPPGAS
jgi:hypothetical protein